VWPAATFSSGINGEPTYAFGAALDFETIVSHAPDCVITASGWLFCRSSSFLQWERVLGVLEGEHVVTYDRGYSHQCAVTVAGRVACWGSNWNAQLGDGTTQDRQHPVWVSSDALTATTVVSVALGGVHTCALTADGEVFCWGGNSVGQVGTGSLASAVFEPVRVNGGALQGVTARRLSVGQGHTCVVTVEERAVCWGANSGRQVSQIFSGAERLPVRVESGALIGQSLLQVEAGDSHTCALTSTGTVICWGAGSSGSLGNGASWNYEGPAIAMGGALANATIASLSVTDSRVCAVSDQGRVICWGGVSDYYYYDDFDGTARSLPVVINQARLWKGTVASVTAGFPTFAQWGGTVAPGDPPTSPTATITFVRDRILTASWLPPSWSGATAINSYEVQVSSDLGVTWQAAGTAEGPAGTIDVDMPRDDYWMIRVIARNSAAPSRPSAPSNEVLVRTEERVVRTGVPVTFSTLSGARLRNAQVSWRTTDDKISSVNSVVTSSDGVAMLPAVATGPVTFSLSGGQVGDGSVSSSGSELTVVIPTSGTVPTVVLPDPPALTTRTVHVQLKNGHRVAGASLSLSGGVGGWASTNRASNLRTLRTDWTFAGWSYYWWNDDRRVTDENGTAVIEGFVRPSVGNDVTVTYSDGTLRQQASGPLLLPELTLVFEQMPFVAVSSALPSGEFSVRSGEAVEVTVEAIDGNGSSLEGATLSFAEVIQGQPLSIGAMGFSLGLASTCLPKTSGVTDANGQTTLRLCPQSSGTWRVVGNNLVPSIPFNVRVEPAQVGGDSPSTGTNPGGGSTGGDAPAGGGAPSGGGGGAPSGGGGGGGGGGAPAVVGEPVAAAVPRPASSSTPVSVGFTVPAGRLEMRLSGLTAAAEATVTVIEAPEASGVTLLPTAFDIDVVTSGRLGQTELCVPIDTGEVVAAGVDPQRLSIYHFTPGPVDITTRVTATQVCGVTSSFSPFALGVPASSRIAGATRYDTAARLVGLAFPGTADLVLVATGANFPDALAASAAAAKADAPLLLVNPTAIPAATRAQLSRLKPKRIVIVGGTAAVSAAVERELARIGIVERVAGVNRFETAARLATRFFDNSTNDAYLVSGDNFPDALAAGAASSYTARPVLLTAAGSLPAATSAVLRDLGISAVTIVGGERAVSPVVFAQTDAVVAQVRRISGQDRYDTAARLADTLTDPGRNMLLATGTNFPDALGAAAVAARLDATLILTAPASASWAASDYLGRRTPSAITVLGGYNAIARSTESRFATSYLR
jgi:putative cell wall-binding protein